MDFMQGVDAPYVLKLGDKEITFPKLRLRTIGVLAAKIKATQLKTLQSVIDEQNLDADKKARFKALTATRDFNLTDVWEWAASIDGGFEIAKLSLVQGGIKDEEAEQMIDILNPTQLLEIAFECCGHPDAPSKQKKVEEQKDTDKKDSSDPK
jgi:hypothetical protein